jgi:hypothetical protein
MPHMEVIPIIIVLHTRGVHHVLKPILESTIKVDIFPAVKKRKKDSPMDTPKPRTALFQEGGNDETSIVMQTRASPLIFRQSRGWL